MRKAKGGGGFKMKRLLIKLVKFYQLSISPLKAPCCKYYPTCSNYAIEAIERFELQRFFMAIYRILRCNPFSRAVMILFLKKGKA